MYTISNRLKTFSIILIVLGVLGVAYGFMTSHKSLEEVKIMLADDGHGGGHDVPTEAHVVAGVENHADNTHDIGAHDATADVDQGVHDDEHAAHVQERLAKRPWSAMYVAAFFFMMISLGVLAFYAINVAAQSGWSPLLNRVMEGISAYLLPGAIIVVAIAVGSHYIGHHNEIFIWMNPEVVADDKLIQNKSSYLNIPWFLIRAAIFIAGWVGYRHFARKFSIAQDTAEPGDKSNFKKSFRIAAGFLVFFIYTESIMSWDWVMSVDPHWFSTLFGWYVLSGMLVSGVTVIAMVAIFLKSLGHLPLVNDSHIHDLAKYMFGFSVLWTYLWFSQFMLIWYANIPEEVTYFVTRIEDYNLPFFGMLVLNFLFPLLILMNSDYKRIPWFVMMCGVLILVGHYVDIFVMIMPATVGDQWFIGIPEIGSILLFGGLFLLVVFSSLAKAPLTVKNNPFLKESEHFHY
ncbi:quinol:cytochrome C oxidoreductase [Gelidibacter salicanalis]|uniref:Quinol:cytochrome C oxidoreductase n=1 Tax=Gelidibacter salicanalis TaxID=291193 RepID=A0A5C7AE88_9FLAO|nr:quinol:cytochrome C oxidoreductase [Gelidibacter salicanalis]TXE06731.1 quinol:cytochrome C oxidoreductase [Gelidibacter salicanalis]